LKWYYPLFILILFLAPSCTVTSIAPAEVVLTHLGVVHEYDGYSSYVAAKVVALSQKGYLKDVELRKKINSYNDASYAYYTRAFVLLASGDIVGYKESIDKAWDMTEAIDEMMNGIIADISEEKKGQGL